MIIEHAPITVGAIAIPKKFRRPKKAAVRQLAESLGRDGLLHPIGVRPNPGGGEEPYELLFGRHRLEAAKLLGWTDISATVFDGLADDVARAMTSAENLFRNQLAPAEQVIALKNWKAIYEAAHPEAVGNRCGGEATRAMHEGEEPPKSFVAAASEQTGQDRKQIEEYLYAGRNLDETQLRKLADCKVPLEAIKRINKLTPDQIKECVSLIAAGLEWKAAIAQVTAPEGATVETVEGVDHSTPEDQMTDEEWLESVCGEVLDRLDHQDTYKADAILYRETMEGRRALRGQAKKPLAKARKAGAGQFCGMLAALVNVDHPKNWMPCGPCNATGKDGTAKCDHCGGRAYHVQKEPRR